MSDVRLKAYVVAVTVALLIVIATGAASGSRSVADDLRSRADRALSAAGIGEVHVSVVGREARLTGPSAVELGRARKIVDQVQGVRRVSVSTRNSAARPVLSRAVPTFQLQRTATRVTIRGAVPDPDTATELKSCAAWAFGVPVVGDLRIDDSLPSAPWATALPAALAALEEIHGLQVLIAGDGGLELSGTALDVAAARRAAAAVDAAAGGLTVVNLIVTAVRG